MNRLIPTAIVDVNGRQTTVHKRADLAPKANSALSGARPSLSVEPKPSAGDKMNTIKPKKLTQFADAVRLGKLLGALTTDDEVESFMLASGRSPVKMSDDEIYHGLRCGITMQDSAALKNLDISADDVMEQTKDKFIHGGALTKISGRGHTVYTTKLQGAIDRLIAAGVPAAEADKMMANGLQDGHFNRGLPEDQVMQVFSRWRYRAEADSYERGNVDQDNVIESFLSGRLPMGLMKHSAKELKNSADELYDLYDRKLDHNGRTPWVNKHPELAERLLDLDYREKLIDKAATFAPDLYQPLRPLDDLVQKYGEEVLELEDPRRATMKIWVSEGVQRECGVDAARYVEKVLGLAKDQTKGDFWGTSGDSWSSHYSIEANGHRVRNWDLLDLHEQGIPAEQAYDMLVNHGLSKDQILVARDTGVGSNLASGVL